MARQKRTYWIVMGMLITILYFMIINITLYILNPRMFQSFSWGFFLFIISFIVYSIYNLIKLYDEIKKTSVKEETSKKDKLESISMEDESREIVFLKIEEEIEEIETN